MSGDTTNTNTLTLETLLQYKRQIDSILQFWFGQRNPDQNQKQLWMVSSNSNSNSSPSEYLNQVDQQITDKFASILISIIHNHNNQRHMWCDDVEWFSWHGKLACIILLDQMSRHIHRYYQTNSTSTTMTPMSCSDDNEEDKDKKPLIVASSLLVLLPKQSILDQIAYSIVQQFQQDHGHEIKCGMIPIPMMIFLFMPYRHASTIQDVQFVLQQVESISTLHSQDFENMIRRFRKATNRRMALLQDEARRTGNNNTSCSSSTSSRIDIRDKETIIHTTHSYHNKEKMEDEECNNNDDKIEIVYKDEDILETIPFQGDFTTASDHIVVKTMIEFLKNQGIYPLSSSIHSNKEEKEEEKNNNDLLSKIPIIVSLSGGVDSMVIASTLVYLRDYRNYNQLYIVAVHIDYGNRPESIAEAKYVYQYSMDRFKLQDCIVQRVDEEYKRGVTNRDEYEKATRNIRYDLYKSTIHSCRNHPDCSSSTTQQQKIGVMLGHHQGDVRENVLSNAHKGCGPLDLSGMTSISMNDGVLIYRPLLTLEKTCIFDYAHKYGIPYFKDTTPHWSTRGKLRNKLLPLLEEIYGDGCMMNLTNLARESDEARQLINEKVLRLFMDTVSYYPMGIIFHTKQFKDQGLYFWKLALRDVLHSAKRGMFGDKMIVSFLKRVLATKIRSGWLQCRNDYAVYLNEDGRVCVFHPESFPPNEETNPFKRYVGQVISLGKDKSVGIGPWQITCEFDETAQVEKLLDQKAVPTWDEFMKGNITYYLTVPLELSKRIPQLTILDHFSKLNRPKAWKGIDKRIERTIPMIGQNLSTDTLVDFQLAHASTVIIKVTSALEESFLVQRSSRLQVGTRS